jgi:hypothetical protein
MSENNVSLRKLIHTLPLHPFPACREGDGGWVRKAITGKIYYTTQPRSGDIILCVNLQSERFYMFN